MGRCLLVLIMLVGLSVPAGAQDVPLSAFFGDWSARSLDTEAGDLPLRTEDLNLTIGPEGQGFRFVWTHIDWHGAGSAPAQRREAVFVPTGRPNVFQSRDRADPLKGDVLAWARMADGGLMVYSLHLAADGGFELRHRVMTLNEDGTMHLTLDGLHDGAPMPAIDADLVRRGG